uniref:Neprosin PEP catalytic domain-containing protein n=1 Tax=Brassica oleracea var. oleracea TaxID=109376 RepID=A0A0D3AIC3_BRAOL
MEPSFIISKQKDQTKTKSESKKFIDCPNGTVPILKNTKEFVTNAQYWANKHFNSFTIDSHGTHFAGVRASQDQGPYHGVEAWMSVHELNISVDQTSYTNIYVASAVSDKVNFIQTGWMVNPTLFGDGRPWSYGLWKGINRTGCYNTICPGFIQVSKTDPLSIPLSPLPKGEIGTYLSIKQNIRSNMFQNYLSKDEETGNWWAADVKYNGHGMNIGYWPKELFDLISTNAGMVGVTGAVQASPSGKSPPMGNGYLPTKSEMGSFCLSSGAATNRYWWLGGWSNDAIDWRLRVTWSGLHVQVLAPGDGGYSRSVVVGFFSGGGCLLRSTVADSSFREGETHTAPPSPAFGHGEWRLAKLRAAVFGFLSLISGLPSSVLAFFLVVVINGSGGDLVFAIDLSDDRISVLKAAAVKMIWSCRARVVPVDRSMDVSPGVSGLWGSRCGSSRWLTGTTVTLR